MGVRPLTVAGVAAVLLVVVLGADLSMNRVYHVDVWTGSAWREVAQHPVSYEERFEPGLGFASIEVNRTEEVRLRLRVDNGYPWDLLESYRVIHNGEEVAAGALTAPTRGSGTSEFAMDAERLLGTYSPREPPLAEARLQPAYVQILVDGDWISANFQVEEVARE